jgi:hypothetical protein
MKSGDVNPTSSDRQLPHLSKAGTDIKPMTPFGAGRQTPPTLWSASLHPGVPGPCLTDLQIRGHDGLTPNIGEGDIFNGTLLKVYKVPHTHVSPLGWPTTPSSTTRCRNEATTGGGAGGPTAKRRWREELLKGCMFTQISHILHTARFDVGDLQQYTHRSHS